MSEYPEEYAEIDGRIFLQTQLLMPKGDYPTLSKVVGTLVFHVQHKLKAMLYHKNNCLRVEELLIRYSAERGNSKARIPDDLLFEFEAFLFQTKSSLDLTIKILEHLFPATFKVDTFANKGKKLISNLEAYKKRLPKQLRKTIDNPDRLDLAIQYRNETIDTIIRMLEDERVAWLGKAVDTRDTVSHHKGSFSLGEYSIEKVDDTYEVQPPKVLDVYPRQFLEITYKNCIEFIQDFVCLFIELWLPPLFCIVEANNANPTLRAWRESNVASAKYIKFTLGSRPWV